MEIHTGQNLLNQSSNREWWINYSVKVPDDSQVFFQVDQQLQSLEPLLECSAQPFSLHDPAHLISAHEFQGQYSTHELTKFHSEGFQMQQKLIHCKDERAA